MTKTLAMLYNSGSPTSTGPGAMEREGLVVYRFLRWKENPQIAIYASVLLVCLVQVGASLLQGGKSCAAIWDLPDPHVSLKKWTHTNMVNQ